MRLLKPGGRLGCLTPGFHEGINLFAENGNVQCALEPVPRDGLQHDPGVVREVPEHGVELLSHFVGRVIP